MVSDQGQCLRAHCLSAKPPLSGRVGSPSQIAVTGVIHAFIMTWELAREKHSAKRDVILCEDGRANRLSSVTGMQHPVTLQGELEFAASVTQAGN